MINEKLLQVLEIAKGLAAENEKLREEIETVNKLNAHLLDRLDQKEDELQDQAEEIDDLRQEILELEQEINYNYEIERKVWEHWQKLKEEGNY